MSVKEEKEEKSVLVPEVVVEAVSESASELTPEPQPVLTPAAGVTEKSDRGWVWMLLAFVLGVVVGTVTGYMVARIQESKVKNQNLTVVQASPTPSASLVVTEIKREDLKVQVLNGSGVAGAAAKAKTLLEELGYVDVAVGNADGDFAETEVEMKASKKSVEEMLKKDLEEKYTLADTIGELDETFDYDVVITLGVDL